MFATYVWLAAAIVGTVFLVMLNRRRRPALGKAYEAFARVAQTAGPELKQLSTVFDRARELVGDPESFRQRGFSGASAKLGQLILNQVNHLKNMSAELQRVLAEGDTLLHPTGPLAQAANMATTSRYLHCLNLIKSPSLQIESFPDYDDMPDSSWVTFDQFYAIMRTRRAVTEQNLERFTGDIEGLNSSVSALQSKLESLDAIEGRLGHGEEADRLHSPQLRSASIRSEGTWFELPSLFDKLVPLLEKETEGILDDSKEDPIGVKNKQLPALQQKLEDVLTVARAIENARTTSLSKIEESQKQLKQLGFHTRWMERRKRELSDDADRLLHVALTSEITELATSFDQNVTKFSVQTAQTIGLAERLASQIEPAINAAKSEMETAREVIAQRLGISASSALRETDYSPDDELQRAAQQYAAAKAAISRGDVDSVNSAIGEIEVETREASRFIENTLQALDEFQSKYSLGNDAAEKLKSCLPQVMGRLKTVMRDYSEDALNVLVHPDDPTNFHIEELALTAEADVDSPSSETSRKPISLEKLCSIAQGWMQETIKQINGTERSFKSGKVLESCNLIDLIEYDIKDLGRFLDRIDGRMTFVQQLDLKNTTHWSDLRERVATIAAELANGPHLVSEQEPPESHRAFEKLNLRISDWQLGGSAGAKPNPVIDSIQLNEFGSAIDEVITLRTLENETYQEVLDAIDGVEGELRIARQLVKHSHNDGIPDSAQITADQATVSDFETRLEHLKKEIVSNRRDLERLDRQATQLQVDLSLVNGRLRNELKTAREASASILKAAEVVFNAAQWRGEYNIVVIGRPGADELNSARASLASGNYRDAVLQAHEATRRAGNGITAAVAQVSRHRRLMARRAREARRVRTDVGWDQF